MRLIRSVFMCVGLTIAVNSMGAPELVSRAWIHGGSLVSEDDPISKFTVAVRHDPTEGRIFCSGVIIDRRWVLTAAHCIIGKISVHFGTNAAEATQISEVRNIFIHPEYSSDGISDNDFALLELEREIPPGFIPITIDEDGSELAGVQKIQVAGYGLDSLGILKTTTLRVLGYNDKMIGIDNPLPDNGIDHGDSGGPNFIESGGSYYLVGISTAIFGPYSGGRYEAVSCRPSGAMDWIAGVLKI